MKPEKKMEMTISIAKQALKIGELPISAVIFHGDKIIAYAHTSEKEDKRFLIHAELKALLEADKMKFSMKERMKMQLFTNLEPCMMCLGAAISFFIGEIYYSLEAPVDGAVDFAAYCKEKGKDISFYQLPKIVKGIMRRESIDLFREYLLVQEPGPLYDFAESLANLSENV